MNTRRLRLRTRTGKTGRHGWHAVGFGLRVGFWPCEYAPFFQLTFWKWRIDIWYGPLEWWPSSGEWT